MAKRLEKQKAIALRQKGYSINEILREIPVSKSTLSLWFRDVELSKVAQKRISDRWTAGQKRSQEVLRSRTRVEKEVIAGKMESTLESLTLNKEITLLICSLLYECEGASNEDGTVIFTNSSPELIKTFLALLRKSYNLDESKFRICMHLHQYHDEVQQRGFWSNLTGIPANQFIKTYQKKNTGKRNRTNYQGCISVRYHDVRLARELITMARLFMERMGD